MTKSKVVTIILIALMAIGISATNAYAGTDGHQAHEGACARSTTSIPKGVGDLQFNNVLTQFAEAVGIHGYDGSVKRQMEEKLVQGTVAHSTSTTNHGCQENTGVVFGGLEPKHLEKGEAVIFRVPPQYGKEACKHPSSKCERVRITVHTVFPFGCWNLNTGTIEVFVWIRKRKHHPHHHHKHHHPHHKKPCGCSKTPTPSPPPPSTGGECSGNNVNNGTGSAGNCNICTGVNVCNPVVTHEEPPCTCTTKPSPPEIVSELHIQELYPNERITFYTVVKAPSGDHLTILFFVGKNENIWFNPSEINVPSFGGQNKFETYLYSSSYPGVEYVHTKVIDQTTGLEAESVQKVETLPAPQNP